MKDKVKCDNCGKEFDAPEDKFSNRALVLGNWKWHCSTECWRENVKPNSTVLTKNNWNYTKFD